MSEVEQTEDGRVAAVRRADEEIAHGLDFGWIVTGRTDHGGLEAEGRQCLT
jgi:hypothetical protein